jgi:hypothetical protein
MTAAPWVGELSPLSITSEFEFAADGPNVANEPKTVTIIGAVKLAAHSPLSIFNSSWEQNATTNR